MDHTLIFKGLGAAITLLTIGFIIGSMTAEEIQTEQVISPAPLECPLSRACQPEKICPSCPSFPICPECQTPDACPPENICPSCPECPAPIQISNQCDWLMEYKCNKWESSGAQYGCVWAWDEISAELGCRNRSRFDPGPSRGFNINTVYKNGDTKPKNPEQFTFNTFEKNGNLCFNVSQYPDQNGRKRWNWNKNDCNKPDMTICHI